MGLPPPAAHKLPAMRRPARACRNGRGGFSAEGHSMVLFGDQFIALRRRGPCRRQEASPHGLHGIRADAPLDGGEPNLLGIGVQRLPGVGGAFFRRRGHQAEIDRFHTRTQTRPVRRSRKFLHHAEPVQPGSPFGRGTSGEFEQPYGRAAFRLCLAPDRRAIAHVTAVQQWDGKQDHLRVGAVPPFHTRAGIRRGFSGEGTARRNQPGTPAQEQGGGANPAEASPRETAERCHYPIITVAGTITSPTRPRPLRDPGWTSLPTPPSLVSLPPPPLPATPAASPSAPAHPPAA